MEYRILVHQSQLRRNEALNAATVNLLLLSLTVRRRVYVALKLTHRLASDTDDHYLTRSSVASLGSYSSAIGVTMTQLPHSHTFRALWSTRLQKLENKKTMELQCHVRVWLCQMKNEELLAIYLVDAAFCVRALLPFLHAPHAKLKYIRCWNRFMSFALKL
jgi:hypothetical protein